VSQRTPARRLFVFFVKRKIICFRNENQPVLIHESRMDTRRVRNISGGAPDVKNLSGVAIYIMAPMRRGK
jgi:hypothetical protein